LSLFKVNNVYKKMFKVQYVHSEESLGILYNNFTLHVSLHSFYPLGKKKKITERVGT
jgi:hypothetical protein